MNNVKQRLESTSLDLQEGLDFESIELTSLALKIHRQRALSNKENTQREKAIKKG